MKNIIKKLAAFLFSDAAWIIMQTFVGMYAVNQGRYAIAYGIGITTILIALKPYKNGKTSS